MTMPAYNGDQLEVVQSAHDQPNIPVGLERIPVAVVGDAMGRLGLCDAALRAAWAGARCIGPAFPIWVTEGDNAAIHASLSLIRKGDVVVVNGGGSLNRSLIGDRLAMKFIEIGVAGVVIDGCIRDATDIAELRFPVWCRGTNPAGPFKNGPGKVGVSVAIGGVAVAPGDIVTADDDGVAIIPKDSLSAVAERAEDILAMEQESKAELGQARLKDEQRSRI